MVILTQVAPAVAAGKAVLRAIGGTGLGRLAALALAVAAHSPCPGAICRAVLPVLAALNIADTIAAHGRLESLFVVAGGTDREQRKK